MAIALQSASVVKCACNADVPNVDVGEFKDSHSAYDSDIFIFVHAVPPFICILTVPLSTP